MQSRAVPAAQMTQAAAAAPKKQRSFLAANWPLMTAAAALLGGGVVMGMAVGNAPRPQPTATVALTVPAVPVAVPGAAPQPQTAKAGEAPTASSLGWRPISELAKTAVDASVLQPSPEPEPLPIVDVATVPVNTVPNSQAVAPVAVAAAKPEPVAKAEPLKAATPIPLPPAAQRSMAANKPVLTAAPMAPPSFTRPAASGETNGHAWRARAVPPPSNAKPPYVALLIDDAGLDRKGTQRAIAMPGPVTLSFMSYANELSEQSTAARAAGHEVMLHLPMEPLDAKRNNPGPNALFVNLDADELQRRLTWHLDRFSDYVGVNNHMGSRFTADAARMGQVLDEINRRQVFWLDSLSGPNSAGPALARKRGVDAAERDIFLDDERSPGIAHELATMERMARSRGDVIAIGHPHGATLTALEKWIATAQERGFTLVPVSTVLLRRQQQER
jgi:polysaccharide deacetylase 2 family uncharacterized protein YibQ